METVKTALLGLIFSGCLCPSLLSAAAMVATKLSNSNQTIRYTTKLEAGPVRTCAMSNDGLVKCWGENYQGSLGQSDRFRVGGELGTMGAFLPAIRLGNGFFAKDICTNGYHACALSADHRVKCWGRNGEGQLGQEHSKLDVGLREADMGNSLLETNLGSDFSPVAIACGSEHVCALASDGSAKCWGGNTAGELGLDHDRVSRIGTQPQDMGNNLVSIKFAHPIRKILASAYATCAMFENELICWGSNQFGQIGIESADNYVSLDKNRGESLMVMLEAPETKIQMLDASLGSDSACALYRILGSGDKAASKLKCWGRNDFGQLGTGTTISAVGRSTGSMGQNLAEVKLGGANYSEVQVHSGFACARAENGYVKCWGINSEGQLGLGDDQTRGRFTRDMGASLPFVDLDLPTLGIAASSWAHSCAILINHQVKCWGRGNGGVLGYESQDNVGEAGRQMGSDLTFVKIW